MDTNQTLLICKCNSTEHQIVISFDEEDNQAYCHIHLNSQKFWSRIKLGMKYIFGYHCRFGHWDEFIFNYEHADKLIELANRITQSKIDRDLLFAQNRAAMESDKLKRNQEQ